MDPAVVESQIVGNEDGRRGGVQGQESRDAGGRTRHQAGRCPGATARLSDRARHRCEYQADHPEYKDEIFIAGMPIFIAAQQEIIDHDLAVLFPIVFLLITLLLTFFFRKPLGVLLPLFNILFCTIWTLGLMALLRVPFDLLTSVLPVFLFTICCPTRSM
jgi:predicted RND superfamily exporter protein